MSPAPPRLAPLPSPTGLSPRPRPKSLFVRLNSFRKASLLSLSSTASSPQCEAPAFTFDDLLRLHKRAGSGSAAASSGSSPRRTHKSRSQTASPRGESQKILRHLVTPPVGHRATSFDEFLHLRTQNPKCSVERTRSADIATELLRTEGVVAAVGVAGVAAGEALVHETSLTCLAPSPSKHDKKVTFAKLLDKMSKEMSSSSSDMSCSEEKSPSRIFNLASVSRRCPRRSPRYSGSGSEDVGETPDISSSEMTPDPPKRLLSVKSASSPSSKTSSPQTRNKLVKISSADSLLSIFRSIGSGRPSSNPPSPHGSDDSSTHASPSTTPTTPQKAPPQARQDSLIVPSTLQVQVQSGGGGSQHSGPMITLEVPGNDHLRCLSPITELPTPVPTPVPSPLPTPSRYHPKPRTSSESNDNKDSEDTESEFSLSISVERSSSDSSGPDHRVFFTASRGRHSPCPPRQDSLTPSGATATPSSSISSCNPSPVASPATSPKVKTKPPPLHIPDANLLEFSEAGCSRSIPLPQIKVEDTEQPMMRVSQEIPWDSAPRTRSQSVDVGALMTTPLITVSSAEDPHSSASTSQDPPPIVIPTLNVTLASPPALKKQVPIVPQINVDETPVPPLRRLREKTGSLELDTPAIKITTHSELESETDSPTTTCNKPDPAPCYLSPFLGVDLRASESNLSSGYSSAYSPGPSRCSSNNPLLPDEPLTPSVSSIPARPLSIPSGPPPVVPPSRTKRRPVLRSPPTDSATVEPVAVAAGATCPLLRTDSETTDDPAASQPEADSALELDTNDEATGDTGDTMRTSGDEEVEAQRQRLLLSSSHSFPKESPRLVRSPPAIVVHTSLHSESSLEECLTERPARLSPVSSRSESPISDSRLSVARIYPAFFGGKGKAELPYTDSDGLYDCPSSEVVHSDSHASTTSPLRRSGRKRLKRSPGKGLKSFLGLGSSEGGVGSGAGPSEGAKTSLEPPHWDRSPRRLSPKRRVRAQTSVDLLSSSNESITSQSHAGSSSGAGEGVGGGTRTQQGGGGPGLGAGQGRRRRPLLRGDSIQSKYLPRQGSVDASGEETQEELLMLRPPRPAEDVPRHRKLSRLRTFGNQIRYVPFLAVPFPTSPVSLAGNLLYLHLSHLPCFNLSHI
ncbi:hypothetical protein Pcinc_030967 [Petrolisthes cinctipes]|uniref:Uncharacterized protein n=1 Tax=Petrolisthes cinctipes TaxID=88211 RepID=A0AAE1EY63_PETCI|nr:hypothetical protein Pcinc_030967 [Petrolisthes cinctipes]